MFDFVVLAITFSRETRSYFRSTKKSVYVFVSFYFFESYSYFFSHNTVEQVYALTAHRFSYYMLRIFSEFTNSSAGQQAKENK